MPLVLLCCLFPLFCFALSLLQRDELVEEICKVTGKKSDTNIPAYLRNNPALFFEMFEQLRDRKVGVSAMEQPQPTPSSSRVAAASPNDTEAQGAAPVATTFMKVQHVVSHSIP